MSQSWQEKSLTVKDIAGAISFDRSEEGIARTIRQVRHWTQCDLLRPLTQKETGKGVARVYRAEPTVIIAALLLELTRYGVTVDVLKPASDQLYGDWEEYGEGWYIQTALTDINTFLQVAWNTDPVTGAFTSARVAMFDEGELRDHFREERVSADWPLLLSPSSSILIHMNEVMERIYPLPWMPGFDPDDTA